MVVTKLASYTPAPVVPDMTTFLSSFNQTLASGCPTPISTKLFSQYDKVRSNKHNTNTGYLEILARYGSGIVGVVTGLVLTAGTGLSCNVSAGGGLCNGIVQLDANSSVVVAASIDNFIWLKPDKTLIAQSTNTLPSGGGIYIGIAHCNGTNVISVDKSGVIYIKGGGAYRETADVFLPSDTPDAQLHITTRTLLGTFLWDGNEHLQHISQSKQQLAPTRPVTALSADYQILSSDPNNLHFTAASTRKVFAPNPATLILGWKVNVFNEDNSGATINIRDYLDTTTLASLFAGFAASIVPYMASGSLAIPATLTPISTASFINL